MWLSPFVEATNKEAIVAKISSSYPRESRCEHSVTPGPPVMFLFHAELWFNPVVDATKKKAVVAKISKEAGFQKYTTNFLNLLVEKDRVNLLNEICESFEEQYCVLTDTQVGACAVAEYFV